MRRLIGSLLCFVTGFVLMGSFEAMRDIARNRDSDWLELEKGAAKLGEALGNFDPDWIIALTGLVGFGLPILIVLWLAGPNVRRLVWLVAGASIVWLPSLLKLTG